ncbi:MAG TPA: DUF6544 family protein [Candidatus Nanopelagicales bacterium]
MRRAAVGLGTAVTAAAAGAVAVKMGASIQPAAFPDLPVPSAPPADTLALPGGLPAPVARWIRGIHGHELPIITSVVVTGRGRINPFGVWLPARFRFVHDAGYGYRHYIEATLFGRSVLAVNERYVDGHALMEVPILGDDSGPKVVQAANLGMWAELAAAAPSVLVTDSRVAWRPIDDDTATLLVPTHDGDRDSFTARFDPTTGCLASLETWRWRSSNEPAKVLWIATTEPGPHVGPYRLPSVGTATWADKGEPWARFVTEDLRYNLDVSAYLRSRGIAWAAPELAAGQ